MVASICGQLAVTKWLVEEGGADINATDHVSVCCACVMCHVRSENRCACDCLQGCHVCYGLFTPQTGVTPFAAACENGHVEVAAWLVSHGADCNAADIVSCPLEKLLPMISGVHVPRICVCECVCARVMIVCAAVRSGATRPSC